MLRGLINKGTEMQARIAETLAGVSIGGMAVGQWLGAAQDYLGLAAIVISIIAGGLSIWIRWQKIRRNKSN